MATVSKIQIGESVMNLPTSGGGAAVVPLSELVEQSAKYTEVPIEIELDDDTVTSAMFIGYTSES